MYSDGCWVVLGEGDIDVFGIIQYLKDFGFEGWIIVEDECDEVIINLDQVMLNVGVYVEVKMCLLLVS